MVASVAEQTIQTLEIVKHEVIAASPEIVFETILEQISTESRMPDGTPFPMKIEPWPGGRWYRDLGHGSGHLWAHVQVIKPPKLLELTGPLFMSYPAISHVQYRVTEEGGKSILKIVHKALGLIPQDHRDGVHEGWQDELDRIRKAAEQKSAKTS